MQPVAAAVVLAAVQCLPETWAYWQLQTPVAAAVVDAFSGAPYF